MNKQDGKKMIEPPIKNQADLIKILNLCSDLRDENKKGNLGEIKNQVRECLCITDDEKYNYYIENNYLRIDRLIIDGKIADGAITNIDELMEHKSTTRLKIQLNKEDTLCTKSCLEDLLRYVFYETDGSINNIYFEYKEIKNFKSVFSSGALKGTKYIFYLRGQFNDLSNINYDNHADLQKHICYKSISSISAFETLIHIKCQDMKFSWQKDSFYFLSRLPDFYCCIKDFDTLRKIVSFGDNSVIYTKLIDNCFDKKSVKNITPFINIISNKKEFWNIVDERIFADTAFYGCNISNAGDLERLGIEFKPDTLYIVAMVLSFVFGVLPSLFLIPYFSLKSCEARTFNKKIRRIFNEKQKLSESKNDPKSNMQQSKNEGLNQKSPIPTMIPQSSLKNDESNKADK